MTTTEKIRENTILRECYHSEIDKIKGIIDNIINNADSKNNFPLFLRLIRILKTEEKKAKKMLLENLKNSKHYSKFLKIDFQQMERYYR